MNLKTLIEPLMNTKILNETNLSSITISSIEMDSRKVAKNSLFVCISGFQVDGHQFAQKAVELGAVAIVAEKALNVSVPVILVNDSKRALAILADRFFESPTQKLKLFGVTGTNGKTTVTHILEKMFEDQGKKTGRIGTINMKIGDEVIEVNNTTPESLELQKAFAKMVHIGCEYAVIEASSHAIHQGRVRGCNFKSVIFTNLTQDHLDYHGNMEEYKRAKGLIFAQLGNSYQYTDLKYAILNADDAASTYYQQITPAQVITYGIESSADVRATDIKITSKGTSFVVECFQEKEEFQIQMLGKFNVYNILAAIALGKTEGLSLQQMKESMEQIKGVSGRLEPVLAGQDFTAIVDYAHTPDSLENVLSTIREFATSKVYCIVGCGGDRDTTKRPIMAKIATDYADVAVFTSDNPRSEDPAAIIADMLKGVEDVSPIKYLTIQDRKEAIYWAIDQAEPSDIILIAGKGHETYQIIKDKIIHFDDREVALEAIISKLKG